MLSLHSKRSWEIATIFLMSREGREKFHLVKWESVSEPKKEGVLSIKSLRLFNKDLLGKLCGEWGRIIIIYGTRSVWQNMVWRGMVGNWDAHCTPYLSSPILRGTLSTKEELQANIRYEVGHGDELLWLDVWVGDKPLTTCFSYLFLFNGNRLGICIWKFCGKEWGANSMAHLIRRNLMECQASGSLGPQNPRHGFISHTHHI